MENEWNEFEQIFGEKSVFNVTRGICGLKRPKLAIYNYFELPFFASVTKSSVAHQKLGTYSLPH